MRKNPALIALFISLIALNGCGGKKTRPDQQGEYGPMPNPTPNPTAEAAQGPQPPVGPEEPVGPLPSPDFVPPKDGYVLVLGPGLARGLSYIGVLHELEARHVSIRAVVGVEIGSVIAGIWASSNLNNLEWEMHKLKRRTVLDFPMLALGNRVAEGKRLYTFLEKALKVDQLQKMKIPVIVASGARGVSESMLFEQNGSAKDILRGAMAIPGVIKPYTFEGVERVTAAVEQPFPVEKAKDLGLGKVVCVDAVNRGDNFSPKEGVEEQLATLMRSVATTARGELKDCDAVISIPMDGVSYLDFDAKADLIYRGKVAVKKWLENSK